MVPKKGPVLARLGNSPTEPVGGVPGTLEAIFQGLIKGIVKTPEDQPKGKEPQVSRDQPTRNSKSQPDLSVPGGEQDRRPKPTCLNPQRRRALWESLGLDTRAPRGAPKPREEVDTSRRARTKEREKARRAQPTGPKVTDRPPEGAKLTPPGQIDLTGKSPGTGATP